MKLLGVITQKTIILIFRLLLSVLQVFHQAEGENQLGLRQVRKSQESYTSDGDSGVGPDSTGSR